MIHRTPGKIFWPALALLLAGCTARDVEPRPNVLLITVDTLRADRVGCYGYRKAATPTWDRLAREGVLFENAFCQVPLTLPSHASILTGLLPPRHGIRLNGPFFLPEGIETLASVLRKDGYQTAAFVSSFVLDSQFGLDRGFDLYDDNFSGGPRVNNPERPAGNTADEFIRWLKGNARSPFFAWVHFFDPHYPYAPPEPYRTHFARSPYDGEAAYTDDTMGRLLAALEEEGILDSTLVVATSDHGEGLGDHGEKTHSFFIYDTTLRIPLVVRLPPLVRGPAGWTAGSRRTEPVQTVDLAPTILALLGVKRRMPADGVNVAGPHDPGRTLYAETWYPLAFKWSPLQSARSAEWKYIRAPEPELYAAGDPAERRNQYASQADAARPLEAWLAGIATAERAGPRSGPRLKPDDAEKLRSLGYLSGSAPSPEASALRLPDPKRRLDLFDRINEARALMNEGQPARAEAMLMSHVDAERDNAVLLEILGSACALQGKHTEATDYLLHVLKLEPDSAEHAAVLAGIYLEDDQPEKAARLAGEYLDRFPRYGKLWDALGVAYGMLDEPEKAVEAGRKAVAIESFNPAFWRNLGVSLLRRGAPAEAEDAFRKALSLGGIRDPVLLYHLALSLADQELFARAEAVLERLIRLQPDHDQAREKVAEIRRRAGT